MAGCDALPWLMITLCVKSMGEWGESGEARPPSSLTAGCT